MTLQEIQEFLRIPKTETIDEFTEAAIRNFQLKNTIPVTGDVSTDLISKIQKIQEGLIDTDLSYLNGNIKKYYLNRDEFFTTNEPKRSIFLHHTAGWGNPYNVVMDWERDTRGRIGTAYVIGGPNPTTNDLKFDGEILECMPPKNGYAWHLGIGNTAVHRQSVGIELCNFGWVVPQTNGTFLTWANRRVLSENAVKLSKPFRDYQFYVRYSDAQVVALRNLIIEIGKQTGIDITLGLQKRLKNMKDAWLAFDYDVNIVRQADGLYSHTNVSPKNRFGKYEKWDIFPQDEIIDMIKTL